MEIISKVSKGSVMDQIYIPKNRPSLPVGTYVKITQITKKKQPKFYYYNVKDIAPIKIALMTEITSIIEQYIEPKNIIFTGSFVDKGFQFNDVDIIIYTDAKENEKLSKILEEKTHLKTDLHWVNSKQWTKTRELHPIPQMMLSKCIATQRITPSKKTERNYKVLDLLLLSSEILPLCYDDYSGRQKYYYTRNMIAVALYAEGEKITREKVDKQIERMFNISVDQIKKNMIEDRRTFIKKYKSIYKETFNKIMDLIPKNDTKQK